MLTPKQRPQPRNPGREQSAQIQDQKSPWIKSVLTVLTYIATILNRQPETQMMENLLCLS
jgi:hypothetical protein